MLFRWDMFQFWIRRWARLYAVAGLFQRSALCMAVGAQPVIMCRNSIHNVHFLCILARCRIRRSSQLLALSSPHDDLVDVNER